MYSQTQLLGVWRGWSWPSISSPNTLETAGDSIWTSRALLGFWMPVLLGPYMVQAQKSPSPSLCLEPPSSAPGLLELVTVLILQEARAGGRWGLGAAWVGRSHRPLKWVLKDVKGGFLIFSASSFLPFLHGSPSRPRICLCLCHPPLLSFLPAHALCSDCPAHSESGRRAPSPPLSPGEERCPSWPTQAG